MQFRQEYTVWRSSYARAVEHIIIIRLHFLFFLSCIKAWKLLSPFVSFASKKMDSSSLYV